MGPGSRKISIHALVKSATDGRIKTKKEGFVYFNPRAREERDETTIQHMRKELNFNPRAREERDLGIGSQTYA